MKVNREEGTMQEAVNEWLIMDEQNMKFHMDQYAKPYRSTVKFSEYLQERIQGANIKILDLGCGAGAALGYILQENTKIGVGIGIDINKEIVDLGNKMLKEREIYNCELKYGDIFELDKSGLEKIDGIISLQVLSTLPGYMEISRQICKLEPKWIAFSILGFEGLIDYNIKLLDYTKSKDGEYSEVFYNIYSLPRMKEFFSDMGYSKFDYIEFEMDIDLPQTNKMGRGTYTVKTEKGKRIQISGGMMMPWYFVFVSK